MQWLIAGTRGGVNRARIIVAIREEPRNANQLSEALGADYRTIRHHLNILEKNGLVTSMGEKYGTLYFLSSELEENFEVFELNELTQIMNAINAIRNKKRTEEEKKIQSVDSTE